MMTITPFSDNIWKLQLYFYLAKTCNANAAADVVAFKTSCHWSSVKIMIVLSTAYWSCVTPAHSEKMPCGAAHLCRCSRSSSEPRPPPGPPGSPGIVWRKESKAVRLSDLQTEDGSSEMLSHWFSSSLPLVIRVHAFSVSGHLLQLPVPALHPPGAVVTLLNQNLQQAHIRRGRK